MTIYIELVPNESGRPRAFISLEDDHGTVRLELLDIVLLYPQEPIDQVVRRQLHRALTVLEKAERSPEGLIVRLR